MKKFFMIALAAMSLSLVSCKKSVEDQAKAYVDALIEAKNNNDFAKMLEIATEVEKWQSTLSEEDKAKADAAGEEYVKSLNIDFEL